MSTTLIDLLDTLRTHLAEFELPQLWSVTVTVEAAQAEPRLSGQLCYPQPPDLIAALLAWADTLTQPRAEVWRIPAGDRVHLSVTGHLPSGVRLEVYGAVPFHDRGLGARLDPGNKTPILLGALRHLTTPGQVTD